MRTTSIAICAALIAAVPTSLALVGSDVPHPQPLVFEGIVVATSPLPEIELSCGVVAPMSLIKYEVKKVYSGSYRETEIIVDHLACGKSGVRRLEQGGHVIVVAKAIAARPPEEMDPLGMRKGGQSSRGFYFALVVAHQVYGAK